MDQVTERAVVYFVMDAVAGARRTPGRHKTGGVPPKPPATLLLSLWPSAFWDFGSLHQRRRGVFSYPLSRQPYLRPRRGGDLGFVSRHKPAEHPIPDVPAAPDVEASCITSCRGRRVSLSGRRCGVTVCLQSRRRRWDCLVLLKDGHTSVRESICLLVIIAGLVLSAPAALLPLIVWRTSGHLLRSTRSSWDLKGRHRNC